MERDEAEKLIDDLTGFTLVVGLASDKKALDAASRQYRESRAKLLAALAPETNQPEGKGRYELTTMVEVNPGNMVSIGDNDWYSLESITGHWRKVEP
jgi:hypothetical protein